MTPSGERRGLLTGIDGVSSRPVRRIGLTVPAADDLRRTIRRAAWRPRTVLRGFWACLVALFVSGCLMTDQSAFVPGPLQPDNCGTPDEFKHCGRPPKPAAAAKEPDWNCVPPQS